MEGPSGPADGVDDASVPVASTAAIILLKYSYYFAEILTIAKWYAKKILTNSKRKKSVKVKILTGDERKWKHEPDAL